MEDGGARGGPTGLTGRVPGGEHDAQRALGAVDLKLAIQLWPRASRSARSRAASLAKRNSACCRVLFRASVTGFDAGIVGGTICIGISSWEQPRRIDSAA